MSAGALDEALAAALALHRAARLTEAEERYRAILAAAPSHGDALGLLGTLYVQTGRFADAIACFDRFLAERAD